MALTLEVCLLVSERKSGNVFILHHFPKDLPLLQAREERHQEGTTVCGSHSWALGAWSHQVHAGISPRSQPHQPRFLTHLGEKCTASPLKRSRDGAAEAAAAAFSLPSVLLSTVPCHFSSLWPWSIGQCHYALQLSGSPGVCV